ncbi:snaclec agkicetin-C subunit beta-like [Athalia rosae]|uniref:snaclec agkicetin-C subunit beta-like n=1 Tax=Athalia rosae TaxID=37344 RepID=UPI002034A7A2|nr:snaclec agkicetin-C subunit beta-like [Athalia rosae]
MSTMSSPTVWFILNFACLLLASANSQWTPGTLMNSTVHPVRSLPPGYENHPDVNAAYKVYNETRSWTAAQQFCLNDGGRLAVIDSWQKIGFVRSQQPPSSVWVGFQKVDGLWVTSENVRYQARLPWGRNLPYGVGDCVAVKSGGRGLTNHECFREYPFVCEIVSTPTLYPRLPNQDHGRGGNFSGQGWRPGNSGRGVSQLY